MDTPDEPEKNEKIENPPSGDIGSAVHEKLLFERIRSSLRHKVISSINRNGRQDFSLGDEELRCLYNLSNRYILPAPIAGLACFISIRWLRRSITGLKSPLNQTQRRHVPTNQRSSKFPQSPFRQQRSESNNATDTNLTTSQSSSAPSSSGWYNRFTWIIDSLISFEVTKLMFLQYPKERVEALSSIPLVAGQSVVSREFCPILLDHFKGTPPESTFNDAKLQALYVMHENCRLRKNYQRQLEYEFDGDTTVPKPGVPKVGPHTAVDFDERFDEYLLQQQAMKDESKPSK